MELNSQSVEFHGLCCWTSIGRERRVEFVAGVVSLISKSAFNWRQTNHHANSMEVLNVILSKVAAELSD
jgi:hypothetical protein